MVLRRRNPKKAKRGDLFPKVPNNLREAPNGADMVKGATATVPQLGTLGGQQQSIPTFVRGQDTRHDAPAEYLSRQQAGELIAAGQGSYIARGRAFRRTDKSIHAVDRKSYEPGRGRPTSLKIAEPGGSVVNPARRDRYGEVLVPMGAMSRYVADQCAGRRGTSTQRAVEGWRGVRW